MPAAGSRPQSAGAPHRARPASQERAAASLPGHPIDHHVAGADSDSSVHRDKAGRPRTRPCPIDLRSPRRPGSRPCADLYLASPRRAACAGPRRGQGRSSTGRSTLTTAAGRHPHKPAEEARTTDPLTGGPSTDKGLADRPEPGRPRQARLQAARAHRCRRATAGGGRVGGQHPRQPGADPAGAGHSGDPLAARAPAAPAGQAARGQGLQKDRW